MTKYIHNVVKLFQHFYHSHELRNSISCLLNALTSIIGSGGATTSTAGNQTVGDKSSTEPNYPILSSFPSTSNVSKCAPGFLNKSPSTSSSQPASGLTMFLSNSFPYSTSKSKSNSPGDN
ncbi:putative WRKY transcription factor 61 [Forsythia ovata]|uniref:WRKY transcription factor 61 n=1 Tax=Forsythia ovata TaxID=205694 RepID=A0ABD1P002_9LAMI